MQLPNSPGTYALFLELPADRNTSVGCLGSYQLPAGLYVYLGSARGKGGLASRLGRHIHPTSCLHWHVDYLRRAAQLLGAAYLGDSDSRECDWSQTLAARPDAGLPVPGFGASDCQSGCTAHLVWFTAGPAAIKDLVGTLQNQAEPQVKYWQPG